MCTSEFSGIACECLKSDETCRAYNGVSISEVDGYRPKTSVLLFIVTKMCIYFYVSFPNIIFYLSHFFTF